MADLTDTDLSRFDLDAPLAELTTNGQQGTLKQFLSQGRTQREIARKGFHGLSNLFATPDSVAAQMEKIIAEVGGDGFIIAGPLTRRYITEATDGRTPAPQKRERARTEYSHAQFRDHMMAF